MPHVRPASIGVAFLPDGTLLVRAPSRGVAARVPSVAVDLLAWMTQPRSADEVEKRYGPPGRRLYEQLVDAGLLVAPDEAHETPLFFDNFASIDVHRRMLSDTPRLEAYERALRALVRPGMAVMDAGTGSGVLAVMAARAGARVVYAVDASDLLDAARDVFAASGVADRVKPVRADFRTVELPEKVDLIVTETFGALGLAEGGVDDLRDCAARNLAPGGRIVPERMSLWLAPVADPALATEALGPFAEHHGVNLSPLRASALHRGVTTTLGDLAAPGQPFLDLPLGGPAQGKGTVRFATDATIVGFGAWFVLHMGDGSDLSTAPEAPLTHWKQQFLPVEPFQAAGELAIEATVGPAPEDRRGLEVELRWDGGASWHRLR